MSKQARWMKVLVIVLAGLTAVFPSFTQVAVAQTVPAQTKTLPAQETRVILPQGEELSDAELQEVDGAGAITAVIGAVLGGAFEYGQERLKGEKINLGSVALAAAYGAVTLGIGLPDSMVMNAAVSAARWTARAVTAVGTGTMSFGRRIANGFNRHIGGPIIRFFTHKK